MAMAMARSMDSDIRAGSLVSIKTTCGDEFQGQVINFDRDSNILLLNEGLESGVSTKFRVLKSNQIISLLYFGEAADERVDLNNKTLALVPAETDETTNGDQQRKLAKQLVGESLPREMMIEILIRVPAPCLIISGKRVCKLWRNIIKSREFARAHLIYWQSKSTPLELLVSRCLYGQNRTPFNWFDFASFDVETMAYNTYLDLCSFINKNRVIGYQEDRYRVKVLDSVDGLVLFYFYITTAGHGETEKELFVCNPLTKRVIKLHNEEPNVVSRSYGRLKFDYKLVFDSTLEKYKVVQFCLQGYGDNCYDYISCFVSILVLNDNPIWRKIKIQTPSAVGTSKFKFSLVAIRENLYWIAKAMNQREANTTFIECMDIVREEFNSRIELPCQPGNQRFHDNSYVEIEFGLIQLKGSLGIAIPNCNYGCEILVLEENGYNWMKLHTICIKSSPRPDGAGPLRVRILTAVTNDQDDDQNSNLKFILQGSKDLNLYSPGIQYHLYSYSLHSQIFTQITAPRPSGREYYEYGPSLFIPTLTSWN